MNLRSWMGGMELVGWWYEDGWNEASRMGGMELGGWVEWR